MKNIINLIVKDEDKVQRVDVFIKNKEDSLSRTRIKNLILKKKLTLNNVVLEDDTGGKISTEDSIIQNKVISFDRPFDYKGQPYENNYGFLYYRKYGNYGILIKIFYRCPA